MDSESFGRDEEEGEHKSAFDPHSSRGRFPAGAHPSPARSYDCEARRIRTGDAAKDEDASSPRIHPRFCTALLQELGGLYDQVSVGEDCVERSRGDDEGKSQTPFDSHLYAHAEQAIRDSFKQGIEENFLAATHALLHQLLSQREATVPNHMIAKLENLCGHFPQK